MFQTLKARRNNAGESAYVVQSSGMPFERNKGKKQRACTLCKLKKLKCVATDEGDSCVKCVKQGLECSYRSTAKSGASSASKSSKRAAKLEDQALQLADNHDEENEQSMDDNLSVTVRDTVASSPNMNNTPSNSGQDDPAFSEGFLDLLESSEIGFDFWSLSNDGGMDIGDVPIYLAANNGGENDGEVTAFPRMHPSKSNHDFLLDYSRGGNDDPREEGIVALGGSSETTPQTTSTPILEPSGWDPNFGQEIPSLGESSKIAGQHGVAFSEVPGTGLQEATSSQPLPAVCYCLERLMQANEDMQVKLVWGAYPLNGVTVSVDDMLQCQKDILVSCETLLECKTCSLRSDYVMLIVSMCHEMMNGIGDLSAMLLPGSQQGSSKRSRSESDGGRKLGLKAGGWRLDDEEEINVIRSLIGIRITRLGSLISLLEKAVKANHPAYEWVIRALRQSITERIAAIGSKREEFGLMVNL
ncbi:hypothetical protein E0Z10_g3264 [Xylaria hypoxylon]|uniref:Zn(2)-C6 fungal-type domain-containing protein n=1 Tax=Xylaria hypoxylon TaxID=37992 RepID=A0A4Z0Z414_9PEZI|nr:hypothetical protein E0Z10_g3264 [Xylaria hypoxylon]